MDDGNKPADGGSLLLSLAELESLKLTAAQQRKFIRRIYGSDEFINSKLRYCIWVDFEDEAIKESLSIPVFADRFAKVAAMRSNSPKEQTQDLAEYPFRFGEVRQIGNETIIIIPRISSENRDYLPIGLLPKGDILTNTTLSLYNAPLWNMALIASRLHLVWIAAVCGRLETRFSYSNTLGWNTFPIPALTEQNKAELTRTAENILLAREAHFPASIAELYKQGEMPENLRLAHEANDELLERIYIGRRFKNDTERLEHLFKLYTEMTEAEKKGKPNG